MSQTRILLDVGTNELEIVEFYINEEKDGYRGYYGINVSKVMEIIQPQPVTAMPQMRHPSVLGAFSYRGGTIVPLIDLCAYLGKGKTADEDPKIIITEFNNVQNAFLVSGVTRIHRISWQQVESPSKFMLEMSRNSITGVVRLDNRVVFLLDMEAIVGALHPDLGIHMEIDTSTPRPTTRYKILHIDDSANIRHLVLAKLQEEGRFEVTQVVDGKQAWDLLLSLKAKGQEEGLAITDYFQGVISDIEMPNLDGLTLCRYIKEDPYLKHLPVAMFSSLISPSLASKCETVHADAQFAKPDLQTISNKMYELILTRDFGA